MSVVLGIDTSTTACSAALLRDGTVAAFRFEPMERGQAERLNPMVADVLAEAGATFADLSLLAVTTGPGAFTGLRIGLACARAVALVTGTPLVGVTTFDALARAVPMDERTGRDIVVCVNGKRRDVFIQRFDSRLRPLGAPGALAPEGAAAALAEGSLLLAGDGAGQLRAALDATGAAGDGPGARLRFSSAQLPPDARHVAAFGLATGASSLVPRPFYIRPPDARMPGGA